MTNKPLILVTCVLWSVGCATDGGGDDGQCFGGKCDGGVDQSCSDPRYGDGVCQPQLDCATPDIDCFRTFDSDAQASAWFGAFEQQLATNENRPARALVPATDPRYVKARDLLDRGWAAFRDHRPVGKLGDLRPALVVVEDAQVNAFVMGDYETPKSGFAVMVQTGLLGVGAADDQMLGVMMHELQHAVGLHLIADTKDRMRRFYLAPTGGEEPIGKDTVEDPRARAAGQEWRTAADQVGVYTAPELGGFPFRGGLDRVLDLIARAGMQNNPAGCERAVALRTALHDDLTAMRDRLGGALTIDLATLPARVDAALSALRDECLAGVPDDLITVLADLQGTTPEMIEAGFSPADVALVKGRHVIDGLAALVASRRAAMRDIETRFTAATGAPWSALRMFSYEEDADDVSVPVLRATNLDPAGNARFLELALPAEARTRCQALLAADTVPAYGVDLFDEHHDTCWRAYHIDELAAATEPATSPRVATGTLSVPKIPRLPLPKQLSDLIAY
ncbi:MAG TPA: M48 family metalloprotease [Kofleriaceae bacterium]|nr:M48 family metalloprotease [Kofleriaceae bacterium]